MSLKRSLLTRLFGTQQERHMKRYLPRLYEINRIEPEMRGKTDAELREVAEFHRRALADDGDPNDSMVPVFAAVREASRRKIGCRHFDVQIVGGMVLFEGRIAEMVTGEGKTLVAVLAATLEGLRGKGVHIVTTSDYLAGRDAEWMGPIYEALGVSVGVLEHDLDTATRQAAYAADITYGKSSEFGFDYLRDNLATHLSLCVQRDLNYAIVDEVDMVLIDEARTPLIISGPTQDRTELYFAMDRVASRLKKDSDFTVDEYQNMVILTEEGTAKAERLVGESLFSPEALERNLLHLLQQALTAQQLKQRDVHYVVQDNEVVIVDEFTGRMLPGRRWSDGLHQAVEAKERVRVQRESQTVATITVQNFFRMYKRLAGMTGTAFNEAREFREVYKLDPVAIPTNRVLHRTTYEDRVLFTFLDKFEAVVHEILDNLDEGRPVLVGTCSVENSERLSNLLRGPEGWAEHLKSRAKVLLERLDRKKGHAVSDGLRKDIRKFAERIMRADMETAARLRERAEQEGRSDIATRIGGVLSALETRARIGNGIKHNVLNAKNVGLEATLVAQAGRTGSVTIATNMAGRGTDILLGGDPLMRAREIVKDKKYARYKKQAASEKALEDATRECEKDHRKVVEVGGLHVIGSERHESRRIDDQLRGRAGRQGDPGSSRFFVSLEDDLMRIFGGERIQRLAEMCGTGEEVYLEHKWVTKGIARAQRRIEERNFMIRKNVVKYDELMDRQRDEVYKFRRLALEGENVRERVTEFIEDVCEMIVQDCVGGRKFTEEWDWAMLEQSMRVRFGMDKSSLPEFSVETRYDPKEVQEQITELAKERYRERESLMEEEKARVLERVAVLRTLDARWRDHLLFLDELKDAIGLRSYAQRNPLVEYEREGVEYFHQMKDNVKKEVCAWLFNYPIEEEEAQSRRVSAPSAPSRMAASGGGSRSRGGKQRGGEEPEPVAVPAVKTKVGPNDPCPCGSGKKYKKCCRP